MFHALVDRVRAVVLRLRLPVPVRRARCARLLVRRPSVVTTRRFLWAAQRWQQLVCTCFGREVRQLLNLARFSQTPFRRFKAHRSGMQALAGTARQLQVD